ncbi:MAG: hypothetical protein WCL23_00910 [Candidatus Moraniibacteriota bacterium]
MTIGFSPMTHDWKENLSRMVRSNAVRETADMAFRTMFWIIIWWSVIAVFSDFFHYLGGSSGIYFPMKEWISDRFESFGISRGFQHLLAEYVRMIPQRIGQKKGRILNVVPFIIIVVIAYRSCRIPKAVWRTIRSLLQNDVAVFVFSSSVLFALVSFRSGNRFGAIAYTVLAMIFWLVLSLALQNKTTIGMIGRLVRKSIERSED